MSERRRGVRTVSNRVLALRTVPRCSLREMRVQERASRRSSCRRCNPSCVRRTARVRARRRRIVPPIPRPGRPPLARRRRRPLGGGRGAPLPLPDSFEDAVAASVSACEEGCSTARRSWSSSSTRRRATRPSCCRTMRWCSRGCRSSWRRASRRRARAPTAARADAAALPRRGQRGVCGAEVGAARRRALRLMPRAARRRLRRAAVGGARRDGGGGVQRLVREASETAPTMPLIMFNPAVDMQSTGYGLVGRDNRSKAFLTAFALKTPVDGAVFRQYPGEFTVWSESEGRRAATPSRTLARSGRRPTTSTRSSTADPSATARATARASCAVLEVCEGFQACENPCYFTPPGTRCSAARSAPCSSPGASLLCLRVAASRWRWHARRRAGGRRPGGARAAGGRPVLTRCARGIRRRRRCATGGGPTLRTEAAERPPRAAQAAAAAGPRPPAGDAKRRCAPPSPPCATAAASHGEGRAKAPRWRRCRGVARAAAAAELRRRLVPRGSAAARSWRHTTRSVRPASPLCTFAGRSRRRSSPEPPPSRAGPRRSAPVHRISVGRNPFRTWPPRSTAAGPPPRATTREPALSMNPRSPASPGVGPVAASHRAVAGDGDEGGGDLTAPTIRAARRAALVAGRGAAYELEPP